MAQELFGDAVDLTKYGLSADFIGMFDSDVLNANMRAVTDECVGRMTAQGEWTAPFTAWGADVTANWAKIVVYELKSIAGMAPTDASVGDENIYLRAKRAREWFDQIGTGDVSPPDLVDSSVTTASRIPAIASDDSRGW